VQARKIESTCQGKRLLGRRQAFERCGQILRRNPQAQVAGMPRSDLLAVGILDDDLFDGRDGVVVSEP
jgi:hypothetical protein